uniref:Uncharacterized protein n=1 Tax=Lactuca sativa TaxID=4236 RepID=A0A9R1W1X4_LACSA|nr:hypothetical protein LSAT_V11C400189350 [Lactuca sativa]
MGPWRIRATMEEIDIALRYEFSGRRYIKGKQNYVDLVDIDTFSIHDIDRMMEEFGHIDSDDTLLYYHFPRQFGDLDFGNPELIDVYIEHGKTNLHTYYMSPNPYKTQNKLIMLTGMRVVQTEHDSHLKKNHLWIKNHWLTMIILQKKLI